jgi:regulator of sigma E protease
MSVFTLEMLGRMVIGEVSLKNLSGPITIADYAGQSAQMGWMAYVSFIALISISLGVLNLLPVPVLDGGHLMYYIAEIIRGRPVSDRTLELGQRVGMVVLFSLMAFALYNDIYRLVGG